MCRPSQAIMTSNTLGNDSSNSKMPNVKVICGADGSKIRSRFLDRLGIRNESGRVAIHVPSPSLAPANVPVTTQQELLKMDHGKPDDSLGPSSFHEASYSPKTHHRTTMGGRTRTVKMVSFANAVEVVPIPSHRDFSDRIKNAIWTGASEGKENSARNILEFSSENWDHRQVMEEDQFLVASCPSGRDGGSELVLIHPVHFYVFQQRLEQQQRKRKWQSFCAVMSAQQQLQA